MSFIYLALGLLLIFLSQKKLTKELSRFVHRLGGDRKAFINFWSAVFLPGTILHEVSHFLVAAMSGLRTGKVEVLPEFIDEATDENKVHLGYVQVSKMNPIQGFLVGIAPFVTGLGLMIWLSTIIPNTLYEKNYKLLVLQIYIFFTIANSFFPSWEDIKHTIPLVVIFILAIIAAWYFGFSFILKPNDRVESVIGTLTNTLFISAILNYAILLPFFILNKVRIKI